MSKRKIQHDQLSGGEVTGVISRENLKVNVFIVIIDNLKVHLEKRRDAYEEVNR